MTGPWISPNWATETVTMASNPDGISTLTNLTRPVRISTNKPKIMMAATAPMASLGKGSLPDSRSVSVEVRTKAATKVARKITVNRPARRVASASAKTGGARRFLSWLNMIVTQDGLRRVPGHSLGGGANQGC
jgi:hypothetical protein